MKRSHLVAVGVAALPRGAQVEMDAVMVFSEKRVKKTAKKKAKKKAKRSRR